MSDAAAASAETQASGRPVKPDEASFQQALDKAEKEHKDVMARFVRSPSTASYRFPGSDTGPGYLLCD